MTMTIEPGKYRHYKGNEYQLIGVAKHSETLEDYAVYQDLHGSHQIWVRPAAMFLEIVEKNGRRFPRFERIE